MHVRFVGENLAEVFTRELPDKLIGDKAYNSNPLEAELREQGVEMIAPQNAIEKRQRCRTVEDCAVISGDGKLSVFSRGCINFAE